MAIYLKYGKIEGNTTGEGHDKWMTVGSLQWGVGKGVSTPTGSTGNRTASLPSVSEVTITRQMDAASTSVFTQICSKNEGEKCQIDLVDTGGLYAQYELEDTIISGYSVSSGGDRPSESLSLNFTKIQFKYTPRDEKNKAADPITVWYDISKGTVG